MIHCLLHYYSVPADNEIDHPKGKRERAEGIWSSLQHKKDNNNWSPSGHDSLLQQTLIERQTNKRVMLTISLDAALESSFRPWHFFFKTCMTNTLTSHAGHELETFLCLISYISLVFVSYPFLESLKTFLASLQSHMFVQLLFRSLMPCILWV